MKKLLVCLMVVGCNSVPEQKLSPSPDRNECYEWWVTSLINLEQDIPNICVEQDKLQHLIDLRDELRDFRADIYNQIDAKLAQGWFLDGFNFDHVSYETNIRLYEDWYILRSEIGNAFDEAIMHDIVITASP
jgi:hypothetical protein